MQVVGPALGVSWRPGVAVGSRANAVASRVGESAVFVLTHAWRLIRTAARAARRGSPTGSLLASARARAAPQLVTAGVGDGTGIVASGFVANPARVGGAAAAHELVLPADPTAPRSARALLQTAVQEWGVDDDHYQDAAMVVTELVANAVDHARTPSTLTLGLDERGLCVAVRDTRPGPVPRPGPVDPAAPRGRGLQMIAALACSWGVTTHIDGKTVWAVLRSQ
jgi:anti-sigma regulatory factor (Ser/Thr protein kinase)